MLNKNDNIFEPKVAHYLLLAILYMCMWFSILFSHSFFYHHLSLCHLCPLLFLVSFKTHTQTHTCIQKRMCVETTIATPKKLVFSYQENRLCFHCLAVLSYIVYLFRMQFIFNSDKSSLGYIPISFLMVMATGCCHINEISIH